MKSKTLWILKDNYSGNYVKYGYLFMTFLVLNEWNYKTNVEEPFLLWKSLLWFKFQTQPNTHFILFTKNRDEIELTSFFKTKKYSWFQFLFKNLLWGIFYYVFSWITYFDTLTKICDYILNNNKWSIIFYYRLNISNISWFFCCGSKICNSISNLVE